HGNQAAEGVDLADRHGVQENPANPRRRAWKGRDVAEALAPARSRFARPPGSRARRQRKVEQVEGVHQPGEVGGRKQPEKYTARVGYLLVLPVPTLLLCAWWGWGVRERWGSPILPPSRQDRGTSSVVCYTPAWGVSMQLVPCILRDQL